MTSLQLVAERAHHAPVVPCEPPDGIRLVYADDRGRQHTVDLHDANLVDFGPAKPLRKPLAYRGQRNFPGWWWSATTRSHVLYESWLERHHIIEADRDARVTGISGQAIREQATWGRLLNDPEWGSPTESRDGQNLWSLQLIENDKMAHGTSSACRRRITSQGLDDMWLYMPRPKRETR